MFLRGSHGEFVFRFLRRVHTPIRPSKYLNKLLVNISFIYQVISQYKFFFVLKLICISYAGTPQYRRRRVNTRGRGRGCRRCLFENRDRNV